MADAVVSNNTGMDPVIMIIAGVVFVIILIFRFKKKKKPKDFEPQLFSKTVYEEFKKKLDTFGLKMKKGRLYISFHEIARIEKYAHVKGRLPQIIVDLKKRTIDTGKKEDDVDFDFLILRCKSNNFIMRILSMGKQYFLLKDNEINIDTIQRKIFLPQGIDLTSYGNVWLNHNFGIEYINDISLKRMSEQMMTHYENMPDRVIHIEGDTAKRERLARTYTELEKGKYDKTKKGDDTEVIKK